MESDIISMVLNISSNEQFYQFLQNTIDEYVGKTGVSHGNINNDVDWSEEHQAAARKYFQNVYTNAAMNEDYKITEKLAEMGPEKLILVQDCFDTRKSEILSKLQTEILSTLDNPLVTEFDWKLKWIIGSSALSAIREPVAQMDFTTLQTKQNKSVKQTVNLEMNIKEVDSFINKLEIAISNLTEE